MNDKPALTQGADIPTDEELFASELNSLINSNERGPTTAHFAAMVILKYAKLPWANEFWEESMSHEKGYTLVDFAKAIVSHVDDMEIHAKMSTLRARIAELEAAAAPVQAIPCWQWVPTEPNEDVLRAIDKAIARLASAKSIYKVALSAAPTPPIQSQVAEPQWEVKEGTESSWRDIMPGDFGLYQALCRRCPDRYQMRIKGAAIQAKGEQT